MNTKTSTPESSMKESQPSALKQFLLSLLATTISIALTFGTAAIIDYKKEQKEKREIVMMVMYDMYNSIMSIEKNDSLIRQSMDIQLQLAKDPSQFDQLRFQMARMIPRTEYTETTERIFSSSIESINTVGNVLFTENVAEFYQMRQFYKTAVCDSVANEITLKTPFTTLQGTLDFDYSLYAIISHDILKTMQQLYDQCKQMMKVTDEEIEAYRKEREQIEKNMSKEDNASDSFIHEIMQLQNDINESKSKLNLE